jgi:hypothetical protein
VENTTNPRNGLKQKLSREMREFVIIFLYLGLLMGAFNTYRWLLLAEYHVGYFVYGYSLVEALVLAKVIIIGESLGIGERFADRPLIVPTHYKTMLFAFVRWPSVSWSASLWDLFTGRVWRGFSRDYHWPV